MTLRARLVELLVGDPPASPAAARDRAELNLLGLRVPALATAFLLLACALLMLDRNYDVLPRFGPIDPRSLRNQGIERLVLFGLLPLGILLALREDPRRYGLGRGDLRRAALLGGFATLLTVPVVALIAAVPAMRDWYGPSMTTAPGVLLTNVLDLVPTEFLLRGFLLFALLRAIGPFGVVVAVVPFVMIHIGKPDLEALSTLGGGLVFGWLNWRTGAIWASAAYHVAIQTTVIVAAAAWAATPA
ncbi:MAG TPA: CPBP family intramembrane glutamic endopeptidase [Candidatus Nanopelagicales bacterium]|nr:CPBP family intramembrane glutamic endopeptidase [Candidatus Nanopelagicales bacterium]